MNTARDVVSTVVQTPIGPLRVVASPRGVRSIEFGARSRAAAAKQAPASREASRILDSAVHQIQEYFAGRRREFDLPLDMEGDGHQQRVWRELAAIPFGRTVTYGQVAARVGTPRGARAVGRACATNPVPLVVPCHRVVGSDGSLHGFGGGLWRKQRLLEHEGARLKLSG